MVPEDSARADSSAEPIEQVSETAGDVDHKTVATGTNGPVEPRTDRAIAAEIGVSDKTVAAARKAASEYSEAEPERRAGKDGKARAYDAEYGQLVIDAAEVVEVIEATELFDAEYGQSLA